MGLVIASQLDKLGRKRNAVGNDERGARIIVFFPPSFPEQMFAYLVKEKTIMEEAENTCLLLPPSLSLYWREIKGNAEWSGEIKILTPPPDKPLSKTKYYLWGLSNCSLANNLLLVQYGSPRLDPLGTLKGVVLSLISRKNGFLIYPLVQDTLDAETSLPAIRWVRRQLSRTVKEFITDVLQRFFWGFLFQFFFVASIIRSQVVKSLRQLTGN